MNALILTIVFAVIFLHTMRFAQVRGLDMVWMGAANYFVGAAVCGILWLLQEGPPPTRQAAVFGSLIGVGFLSLYFLFLGALTMVGPAITQCITRLSFLMPVIASVVVYDRRVPGVLQWLGIILALVSLPLLTRANPMRLSVQSRWKAPILILAFLLYGAVSILMKAYAHRVPEGGQSALLFFVFGVSFLGLTVFGLKSRSRPSLADCLHGMALGLTNVAVNYTRIAAIAAVAGAVFFPTETAATIVLSILASVVIWKERFSLRTLLGVATAIAALVLVNVGHSP